MIVHTHHGTSLRLSAMPVGHCVYIPSLALLAMRLSDNGRDPEADADTVRVLQLHGSHVHLLSARTEAIYLGEPTLTLGPGRIPTLEGID